MADDEDKPDEPSLRVVPLHPDAWASPQWLSTGENVVAEVNRKHGDHFIVTVGGVYWWNEHLWVPDERHMLERSSSLFVALNGGGILKAPVNSLGITGKDRTALCRPIADGDHVVEALADKSIH